MSESLNIRRTLVALAIGAGLIGGVWLLHRWQVRRQAPGLLELARTAESKGRYDRAAWLLNSYLELVPGDLDARTRYAKAQEALASRDPKAKRGVAPIYEQILDADPDRTEVRNRLARIYLDARDYSRAQTHLEALKAQSSADPKLALMFAQCQLMRQDWPAAIASYRRVIELDPKQVGAYSLVARLLRTVKNPQPADIQEADRIIDRMVEANPREASAYLARARYHIAFFGTARFYDPAVHAVVGFGHPASVANNDHLNPDPDVRSALELAPHDIETLLFATDRARNLSTARQHVAEALKHHPDDPRVYLAMATIEEREGNRSAAAEILRKGLGRLPGQEELLFRMANLLVAMERPGEADRFLTEIVRWKRDPERTILLQGRIRMAERRWREARELIEAGLPTLTLAADRDPSRLIEAYLLVGQCHEQIGEQEQALGAYRRALARDRNRADTKDSVARTLIANRQWAAAAEEYRSLAEAPNAPRETQLKYVLFRTLEYVNTPSGNRRPEQMEAIFAQFEERIRNSVDILLCRIEMLLADKRQADAERLLRAALAQKPESTELGVPLSRLLYRNGKTNEAWAVIEELDRHSKPTVGTVVARLEFIPTPADPRAGPSLKIAEDLFARTDLSPIERTRLAYALTATTGRWGNANSARRWLREVAQLLPNDLTVRVRLFELAGEAEDRGEMEQLAAEIHKIEGGPGAYGHYVEALLRIGRSKDHTPEGFRQAREELRAAAVLRPSWASIPTTQAMLNEYEKKPDEALADYLKAIQLGERRPAIIRRAVQLLCIRRRYPEAERLISDLGPDGFITPQLQRLAAEVSLISQENKRAVELATAAVAADSNAYDDLLWRAEILAEANKVEILGEIRAGAPGVKGKEVVDTFRRALELGLTPPKTAEGKTVNPHGAPCVALVRYYVRTGQPNEAEKVIEEIERRLTGPERTVTLAQCQEAVGRVERAGEAYRAAVEAQPSDLDALRQMHAFHNRTGTLAQSESALRRALAGKPTPADATWMRRALSLALATSPKPASYPEALRLIDQNLAAEPGSIPDRIAKARVLGARTYHRPEAARILGELQRQRELDPASEFFLAQLYAQTGQWPDARRVLTDLIARDAGTRAVLRYLVERLLRNGEIGEAESWLERLEQLAATEPTTIRLRAILMARDGKPREVADLITKSRPTQTGASLTDTERGLVRFWAGVADELGRESAAAGDVFFPVAENLYRDAAKGGTGEDELALARFLGRRGKIDESFRVGRAAETRTSAAAYASALLAIAFSSAERTETQLEALELEVKACLGRAKPSPTLGSYTALMHARRGRYAEAAKVLRGVVDAEPMDAGMVNNLTYMLILANSSPGEVPALLDRVLALSGPSAGFLDTRGMHHLSAGRTAEAIADFENSISQDATAARCLHRAMAAEKAAQTKDVVSWLRRAGTLRSDGSLVLPAEAREFERLTRDVDAGK